MSYGATDSLQTKREIQKAQVLRDPETGQEDYFALQARCIGLFGPPAGVFIRQLVFWAGKGMDAEGWIYKTYDEMQQETGLSRRQQDKARKVLTEKGVLKYELRGVPPHGIYRARHFWVDLEALHNLLTGNSEQQDVSSNSEQELLPTNSEREPLTGNSGQATENTSVENYRATQKPLSDKPTGEPVLQTARNGHFAPPQDIEQEVKRLFTSTDNAKLRSPLALEHYKARRIALGEVSVWVSLDLFGKEDEAERLAPTVRAVLEELAPVKEGVAL